MGNLSHGVRMYRLIINFHNVQFTHRSSCTIAEPAGHACRLLAPLDTRMGDHKAGSQHQLLSQECGCQVNTGRPGKFEFQLNAIFSLQLHPKYCMRHTLK